MPGIFSILHIGASALNAQQAALAIVGHNIANVNTPGYARQVPTFITTVPELSNIGPMGTGVAVSQVLGMRDRYIENTIYFEMTSLGNYLARQSIYSTVEPLFDESEEIGIGAALNDFFASVQDLAGNPAGMAERESLRSMALSLISYFNQTATDLSRLRGDVDRQIQDDIIQINDLSTEIAALNFNIHEMTAAGGTPNDLIDQRNQLIQQLSQLVDINVLEGSYNTVSILVGGSALLVDGDDHYDLSSGVDPDTDMMSIYIVDHHGDRLDIASILNGGEIYGYLQERDVNIPDLQQRLDELAYEFATQVNAIHITGINLNGTSNFFFADLADEEGAALMISLSDEVAEDAGNIAAGASGAPGDNSIALAMADLQTALTMDGGSETFSGFYRQMVTDVGVQMRNIETSYEHQIDIVTQLINRREQVSGVSIDEEMTRMIMYQNAYEAAARLISVAEETMDALIKII